MAVIHFVDSNENVELPDGSPIKEVCQSHGVVFGCEEGNCGTCLCTLAEGKDNMEPLNEKEREFFGETDGEQRLACQARIRSGRISLYQ